MRISWPGLVVEASVAGESRPAFPQLRFPSRKQFAACHNGPRPSIAHYQHPLSPEELERRKGSFGSRSRRKHSKNGGPLYSRTHEDRLFLRWWQIRLQVSPTPQSGPHLPPSPRRNSCCLTFERVARLSPKNRFWIVHCLNGDVNVTSRPKGHLSGRNQMKHRRRADDLDIPQEDQQRRKLPKCP